MLSARNFTCVFLLSLLQLFSDARSRTCENFQALEILCSEEQSLSVMPSEKQVGPRGKWVSHVKPSYSTRQGGGVVL